MRFSITRKINLSNIDKEIWPYETEDISVSDADSFEEAQQKADQLVAERIGYYKRISEESKIQKSAPAAPQPLPIQPAQSVPAAPVAPAPAAPASVAAAQPPVNGAVSAPPEEFNV